MKNYLNDLFLLDGTFETTVGKDLFWVPYCTLGGLSKNSVRKTVLDSLVFFIQKDFRECDDTIKIMKRDTKWELHRTGEAAFKTDYGCCSSVAGWVCYDLKDKYEEVGMISISRPTGSGHALNYVKYKGDFYIFDFLPYTRNYDKPSRETGVRQDFLKTPHFTSCCLKTSDLSSFSKFFGRLAFTKGYSHSFYQIMESSAPPIAVEKKEVLYISYQKNKKIRKLDGYNETGIITNFVSIRIEKNDLYKDYFV